MNETDDPDYIPYELIILEIEGKLPDEEQKKLALWRTASPANEGIYQKLLALSYDTELLAIYQKADPELSWTRFSTLLNTNSNKPQKFDREDYSTIRYLRWVKAIAAITILALTISFLITWNKGSKTIITSVNEQRKITLPDSSEISLNGNSEISYNVNGYMHSRLVKLIKGEAFFNVVHKERNPFIVKTGKAEIYDIGTTFDVKLENQLINVIVNTGSVSLTNIQTSKKVLLYANNKGTLNISSGSISVADNTDSNYKSWYDKDFQFIQTPLNEVVEKIEKAYGIHVVFKNNSLKKRKLTATFHHQSIDDVMNIISTSLVLKVEKKDNVFYLKN